MTLGAVKHSSRQKLIFGAALLVLLAGLVGIMVRPIPEAHAQAGFAQVSPKAIFDPSLNGVGTNVSAQASVNKSLAAAQKNVALVKTLPYWSGIFTYNGTPGITYPYQMLGTNPATGGTTHIKTVIVPINVKFAATGDKYQAGPIVAPTVNSPEFQNASFYSGNTQYGDAQMRAEFQKIRTSNFNVLLDQPQVTSTVNLTITPANGEEVTSNGVVYGDIEINYWDTTMQNLLFSTFHFSPDVFPIFLTHNIVLYEGDPLAGCCIIGYHNDVPYQASNGITTDINVYAWASYTEGDFFPASVGILDVDALSHEIAETLNDPFTDNVVPNWEIPSEPQYGCSNLLEVGDPLVGTWFLKNGYHLQDLVFYSWFARQDPSIGHNGWYTFQNNFGPNTTSC